MDKLELDRVLARVKKMMALANDPRAAEGERDNALRMAHATLAKYNLTMAEAESAGRKPEEARTVNREYQSGDFPWVLRTVQSIALLFFCDYFYVRAGPGKVKHCFVGRTSNVTTARELAMFAVASILKESNLRAREWKVSEDGKWSEIGAGGYARNFAKGASQRVTERCRELRHAAEAQPAAISSTGTSIVLASYYKSEMDANRSYLSDLGIRLGKGRGGEHGAGTGYGAGRAYGENVQLHPGITQRSNNTPRLK